MNTQNIDETVSAGGLRSASSGIWPLRGAALVMLKWGLGVTFIWISLFIFRDPLASTRLMFPWAIAMVPIPLEEMMWEVAIIDLIIGLMLLSRRALWLGAVLATLHLLAIFVVTGVNSVTVRNIGLTAGCIAIAMAVPAPAWARRLLQWRPRHRGASSAMTAAVSARTVSPTAHA